MPTSLAEVFTRLGLDAPECHSFIGPGWLDPLERCLIDLLAYDAHLDVAQVKQKYRGLCIYVNNATPEMRAIINDTARLCTSICETCGDATGKPSVMRGAWLCVLCVSCKTLRKIPYTSMEQRGTPSEPSNEKDELNED